MAIKQLSVFIENKEGKLSDVVKVISDKKINLRALSIADSQDFGILRLIVPDTDNAKAILSEDFIVNVTSVVAVKMDDEQGALYDVLSALEDKDINIDYAYAFTAPGSGAYVVLRVDNVELAENALKAKGLSLLTEEEL